MTAKEITAKAFGKQAFENGKPCVAAHDKNVLALLVGNHVGQGKAILKAWNRGWHEANAEGGK